MNKPTCPERFHALDATRAFALLLGVVFHAAWSFVPTSVGAPIVDVKAGAAFDWFFFTSHIFRMQLFFLIAGFFAHLVAHRRGFSAFARDRLKRIGVPLLLGWIVLFPLVIAAFSAGANISGRNLLERPLTTTFSLLYEEGLMFVPRSSGGMFGLAHFWFLYYLLLLYALVISVRFILTSSGSFTDLLRTRADAGVKRVMQSPWSILWLAVGIGLFLWPMKGWFGVDTPTRTLTPSVPVLVFYGLFFVFGWFLHRQAHLLKGSVRHWRWQLALGLALSIPLFGVFKGLRESGTAGFMTNPYPRISSGHITNWPSFLIRLQSASNPSRAPAELVHLWAHLKPDVQKKFQTLTVDASPDQRVGMAKAMDKLLAQPDLFRVKSKQPQVAASLVEAQRVLMENRLELERLFAGFLAGDPLKSRGYHPMKLAYSVCYALVLWLLLFGTLGFFQARCNTHSAASRYLADSSYWVYLAHLPLVAGLQVWMAAWTWPAPVKFAFLLGIAFFILYASYHYLVRSTFIGRTLNGRAYPFHWNPLHALGPATKQVETAYASSTLQQIES